MGINSIRFKRADKLGIASFTIPSCESCTLKKKKVTKFTLGLYNTSITLFITCHFNFTKYILLLFYNNFIFIGKLEELYPILISYTLISFTQFHQSLSFTTFFPLFPLLWTHRHIHHLYYFPEACESYFTHHDP